MNPNQEEALFALALTKPAAERMRFLNHATRETASGDKPGIDATKKMPGGDFKRAQPRLLKWMKR